MFCYRFSNRSHRFSNWNSSIGSQPDTFPSVLQSMLCLKSISSVIQSTFYRFSNRNSPIGSQTDTFLSIDSEINDPLSILKSISSILPSTLHRFSNRNTSIGSQTDTSPSILKSIIRYRFSNRSNRFSDRQFIDPQIETLSSVLKPIRLLSIDDLLSILKSTFLFLIL